MNDATTPQLEIRHPEVWELAARIRRDCIKYAVHSRMEDNSLSFGTIHFDKSQDNRLDELEAAVYDNSFFLTPFGRRTFLVDSDRFALIPDEFSANNPEECRRYYDFLYPNDDRHVQIDEIQEAGLSIVYGIDPALDSFLRRTFDNPTTAHSLTPLLRFFKTRHVRSDSNVMFAHFSENSVGITAFRNLKPAFANIFNFDNADDAFYYVMAAWQQNGMRPTDSLRIVGDKDLKSELLPRLREHLKNVAQLIFPAELLRMGKDAMQAPFDLVILPLCE